jgi:hypothetical protein
LVKDHALARFETRSETLCMTQPAPRLPDNHESQHLPVVSAGAPHDETDALLQGEWGYEAADPSLQARLWGEAPVPVDKR